MGSTIMMRNPTSYIYSGQLPDNTDLDDITMPGNYFLNTNNYTYANIPPSCYHLIVSKAGPSYTSCLQMAFSVTNIYFRFKVGATSWSAWRVVSTTVLQ